MTENKNKASSRRSFLGNSLRLTLLGSLAIPLHQGCSDSSVTKETGQKEKRQAKNNKKARTKWNHENLIAHTKTNVVHFPTAKYFRYYDKIDSKYIRELDINNWEQQVQPPLHFHRQHAAIILEILALQKLVNGLVPESLTAAEKTLSRAFSNEFENGKGQNIHTYSFRLHDLLLKCIALNSFVPATEKWNRFLQALNGLSYQEKEAGSKKGLPSRMRWLVSPTLFDSKVNYILENQNQFISKLQKRIIKNRFI